MDMLFNHEKKIYISSFTSKLRSIVKPLGYSQILTALVLLAVMSIFYIGTDSTNTVLGYTQYVQINIDKTDYYLGDYGVHLYNVDTGVSTQEYYTDTTDTPFVTVEGFIEALRGDTIQACVMQMSTNLMACDTQYATGPTSYVNFYVSMFNAR
jgi:hypothetical protein